MPKSLENSAKTRFLAKNYSGYGSFVVILLIGIFSGITAILTLAFHMNFEAIKTDSMTDIITKSYADAATDYYLALEYKCEVDNICETNTWENKSFDYADDIKNKLADRYKTSEVFIHPPIQKLELNKPVTYKGEAFRTIETTLLEKALKFASIRYYTKVVSKK